MARTSRKSRKSSACSTTTRRARSARPRGIGSGSVETTPAGRLLAPSRRRRWRVGFWLLPAGRDYPRGGAATRPRRRHPALGIARAAPRGDPPSATAPCPRNYRKWTSRLPRSVSQVDFEEFYNFGCALEHHITLHCDPQELLRDMFEIIDDDKGGLITVQELHATIREIGQELSIDDVRAAAREIRSRPEGSDDDSSSSPVWGLFLLGMRLFPAAGAAFARGLVTRPTRSAIHFRRTRPPWTPERAASRARGGLSRERGTAAGVQFDSGHRRRRQRRARHPRVPPPPQPRGLRLPRRGEEAEGRAPLVGFERGAR